jgi:hypothetical protein
MLNVASSQVRSSAELLPETQGLAGNYGSKISWIIHSASPDGSAHSLGIKAALAAPIRNPDKNGSGQGGGSGHYGFVSVRDLHIFPFCRDRDGKLETLRALLVELFRLVPQQVDQV